MEGIYLLLVQHYRESSGEGKNQLEDFLHSKQESKSILLFFLVPNVFKELLSRKHCRYLFLISAVFHQV